MAEISCNPVLCDFRAKGFAYLFVFLTGSTKLEPYLYRTTDYLFEKYGDSLIDIKTSC